MIGIIVAILCLVLFPVWPYELKYVVWLISLYLLIFLVGLLILRLVLYSIVSLFGVSFWLFPNLMQDKGFIDSFKPVLSFERWERSKVNIILRVVILAIFVYYAYVFYTDPTII
jgi:translocation protein SEC62